MGDTRRFNVLANFVADNFRPCRVADIAGGTGQLSYWLNLKGFECTIIDPRHSALPRDLRQANRRHGHCLSYQCKEFIPSMAKDYDLLIGLHPDEATEPIAQAAVSGSTVVLVTCCDFWKGVDSHGSPSLDETIRRYWRRNGVEWWETILKMSGRNHVFVTKRNHKENNDDY